MKRLVYLALAATAAALFLRRFVIQTIYIASASMEPTLTVGSNLFLDKVTYRFREPGKGEIISFSSPAGETTESVKRVIATGGDRISLKNKTVYLNGQPLREPYTQYTRSGEQLAGDTLPEMEVPSNMFFVLGDNRDQSLDSATWRDVRTGERVIFLKRELIEGKIRGAYRKWE